MPGWINFQGFLFIIRIDFFISYIYNKNNILNAKSVKHIAQQIERIVPPEKGKLYEYIEKGVQAKGDPVHFYELNFYLRDRIGNFHTQRPSEGYLLIGEEDVDLMMDEFKKQGYRFPLLYTSAPEPVFKQTLHLYSFSKWKMKDENWKMEMFSLLQYHCNTPASP